MISDRKVSVMCRHSRSSTHLEGGAGLEVDGCVTLDTNHRSSVGWRRQRRQTHPSSFDGIAKWVEVAAHVKALRTHGSKVIPSNLTRSAQKDFSMTVKWVWSWQPGTATGNQPQPLIHLPGEHCSAWWGRPSEVFG